MSSAYELTDGYKKIEDLNNVQEYSMLTSEDRLMLKEFEAGKFALQPPKGFLT